MIMQTTKQLDEFQRPFTRILHEARNHWHEYRYDDELKTASGLLATNDGEVFKAEMSFDDNENRLSLTVRWPFKKDMETNILRQVIRYQNHHRNHCSSLAIDDECQIACVVTNVPVCDETTSFAVPSLFNSACEMLEDEDLKTLLN